MSATNKKISFEKMTENLSSISANELPSFPRFQRRITKFEDLSSDALAYFKEEKNHSKIIKFILSLPPHERTNEMIDKVFSLTRDLKFFQNLREEHTDDIHYSCCKFLQFEFCPADSVIIKQGDPGSKFYILIEGKANVIRENEDGSISLIAEISDGESFGERSLLLGVPRAATILSLEDCSLGVLEQNDYKKILESFMEERYVAIIEMLRHLPMLKHQSNNYLQRLTYYFRSRKVKKRQIIYKEGEVADEVYLIQHGEFSLFKKFTISLRSEKNFPEKSPLKERKISKQNPIAILSKGTMFGEEEITSGEETRQSTCICNSNNGVLLIVSKENFMKHVMKSEDAIDFLKKRSQNKLTNRQAILDTNVHIHKLKSGLIPLAAAENDLKSSKTPKSLPKLQSSKNMPILSPKSSNNTTQMCFNLIDTKAKKDIQFSSYSNDTEPKSPTDKRLFSSTSFDKQNFIDNLYLKRSLYEEETPILSIKRHAHARTSMVNFHIMESFEAPKKIHEKPKSINMHTFLMRSKTKKYHKFNSAYKSRRTSQIDLKYSADLEVKKFCQRL